MGPALGGLALSLAGPTWVFAFNALCCVAIVAAVRGVPAPLAGGYRLPPETIAEGVIAGLRFARHSSASRSVMLRAGLFGIGASTLWAPLPVVAAQRLRLGPEGYGLLLSALGFGAVVRGFAIGALRSALGTGRFVVTAAFAFALALAALAATGRQLVLLPLLMLGGVAWVGVVSTYNTTIQLAVPGWVRGRALALYQTALNAGLAIGALAWGQVAERIGLSEALGLSAVLMVVALPFTAGLRFPEPATRGGAAASTPEAPLPDPSGTAMRGRPILVLTQYRVPLDRRGTFATVLRELRGVRLRNEARYWAAFRDVADPELWNEGYFVDNWLQQLRLLQRITPEDAEVVARAVACHVGTEPPQTRRVVVHGEPDPEYER